MKTAAAVVMRTASAEPANDAAEPLLPDLGTLAVDVVVAVVAAIAELGGESRARA
jgi:hypothetical protein